ncbi:LysM peptidoglycan-binding domain-containing protein [bacterium]|nr:LysM peptidoglycan-binding domain-containing protein [bacterium]
MNRKEIIVFSVFVNTALLIALFIFALRPTLKGEMNVGNEEVVIVDTKKPAFKDKDELEQVDEILKEYIAKATPPLPKEETVVKKKTEIIAKKEVVKPAVAKPKRKPVQREEKKERQSALIEVIVRQGDVLEKIARRYHTTVDEIMEVNKMDSTRLRIGQILYVRENTRKKRSVHTSAPKKKVSEKYYIVKSGDNPWTIAINNHIKVSDLLRLNGLNEKTAKKMKPGQKLRVR